MKKLILLLLLLPSIAFAATPYLCPPARVNTDFTVLGVDGQAKPAQYVQFYDSAYSTCRIRMTDVATTSLQQGHNLGNLTPFYSQLQAWNADQSKIMLSSERVSGGFLYDGRNYIFIRKVNTGIGNFRWSPIYPDTGYFSSGNQFKQVNTITDAVTTLRTFSEYPGGLEIGNEQEDVEETGKMVVLEGYYSTNGRDTISVTAHFTNGSSTVTTVGANNGFVDVVKDMFVFSAASGVLPYGTRVTAKASNNSITLSNNFTGTTGDYPTAFVCSEVFVYHIDTNIKGSVKAGWAGYNRAGGLDDMLMSPSGKYMILVWGSGGTSSGDSCGYIAYDTTGAFAGKIACGHGHFDTTIDSQNVEWAVMATSNNDCGINGASLTKFRIPDGHTQYVANGNVQNASYAIELLAVSDSIGGSHVSGRAFRKNFVILSLDHAVSYNAPEAFRDEIVKVYLNSTLASPKFERLANHRSNEYNILTSAACSTSSYWGQPHATVSRDGTRILFGSSWGSAYNPGINDCTVETYVQDIYNNQRNETFVNQTADTWRRLTPAKVKKFDGTGLGAADTFAVYHDYSHATFAPEYGGIFYYGGGGHGGRKGNDVWYYNTGDTTWTQITAADTLTQASYPADGNNGGYSVRSFLKVTLGNDWATGPAPNNGWSPRADPSRHGADDVPAAFRPWGAIKNTQRPWSAHIYQQQWWDKVNRAYNVWNPQWTTTPQPDSAGQPDGWYGFRSKNTFKFNPYNKQWTTPNDTLPDLYAGNGGSAYDPIHRLTLAFNYDCAHTAGSGDYWTFYSDCKKVAVRDSNDVWTMRPAYPKYCDAGQDTFRFYGDTASWDRLNNKFIVYSGQAYATNCTNDNSVSNNNIRMRWYDAVTDTWSKPPQLPDPVNGYPPNGDAFSAYSSKDSALLIFGYQRNYGVWSPAWKWAASNGQWTKLTTTNQPYIDGGVTYSDVNEPLTYDPVNNIFLLIRWKNGEPTNVSGSGGSAMTNGSVSEMWAYKMSPGDGRLSNPTTPAFSGGGGGGCVTPGF